MAAKLAMHYGERLLIEIAYRKLLNEQACERDKLRVAQEEEREKFYRSTKAHWDTKNPADPPYSGNGG